MELFSDVTASASVDSGYGTEQMDAASTRSTDTGPYAGGDARTSSPTLDMEWVQALEAEDPKRMGHGSRTNKHARRALRLVLLLGRRGQLIALLPDMDQLNPILRGLVN